MKYINIGIGLSDELAIKSITFLANDTELPSDSKLIELLAFALLKTICANRDDFGLQDLLNEVGISKPDTGSN